MGSLPYRGESWTAGVCLPTADAKLLLRHLFLLLARLTAGESAGWSEDDGRRVATSGGGPAKFLDMVLVQDEGPAPCLSPTTSCSSSFRRTATGIPLVRML